MTTELSTELTGMAQVLQEASETALPRSAAPAGDEQQFPAVLPAPGADVAPAAPPLVDRNQIAISPAAPATAEPLPDYLAPGRPSTETATDVGGRRTIAE